MCDAVSAQMIIELIFKCICKQNVRRNVSTWLYYLFIYLYILCVCIVKHKMCKLILVSVGQQGCHILFV